MEQLGRSRNREIRGSVQELGSQSVKGLPCLGLDHGFFLGRWKAKRALGVMEDRTSGQCCCCHPEKRWQGGN